MEKISLMNTRSPFLSPMWKRNFHEQRLPFWMETAEGNIALWTPCPPGYYIISKRYVSLIKNGLRDQAL